MAQEGDNEAKPATSSSSPAAPKSVEQEMATKSTMIPSTSWFTPKR
jgi:hypothetical protein